MSYNTEMTALLTKNLCIETAILDFMIFFKTSENLQKMVHK